MVLWRFRSCPRCQGDLFLDRDEYNWYEQCMQCGYIRDLKSVEEFHELMVGGRKEWAVRRAGDGKGGSEEA